MSQPCDYGNFYHCVKVSKDLSADGEIYVHGDRVQINQDGSLAIWCSEEGKAEFINLLIAPGKWFALFAASQMDGAAVAVEYWNGEVIPMTERRPTLHAPDAALAADKPGGNKRVVYTVKAGSVQPRR